MAHSRLLSVKVNSLPTDLKFYKFLATLLLPNLHSVYLYSLRRVDCVWGKCRGKDGEGRWRVVYSINNTSSCSDKCTRAPPTWPVLTPESINDQNWNCVSIKKQSILRRIPAKNWVLLCKSVVVNFYHSQWLSSVGICNGKRVIGINFTLSLWFF